MSIQPCHAGPPTLRDLEGMRLDSMQGGPLYDISPEWHVVFLATHLAWLVSEVGLLRRASASVPARRSKPLVFLLAPTGLVVSMILCHEFPGGRIGGRPELILITSLLITWSGIAVRLASLHGHGILEGDIDIDIDRGSRRKGLYRWIRHPAYTGGYMTLLGVALGFGNAFSLGTVALTATILMVALTSGSAPYPRLAPVPADRRWRFMPFVW